MTRAEPLVLGAPAAAPVPIALRHLPRGMAALQHRLARMAEPLAISAQGAQLLASLDAPRAEPADQPWLALTLDGAPAHLKLPWGLARRIAGETVEGAAPDDAAVMVEAGLADWLDEAEAATGLTLRLLSLGEADPPAADAVAMTLNLQGRDAGRRFVQMRLPLRLSARAAAALAGALDRRAAPRPNPAGLVLRLAWERDAAVIPLARLAALRPGDAFAPSLRAPADRLVLEDRLAAPAEPLGGGRLRLLGGFVPLPTPTRAGESAMSDAPEAPAAQPALTEAQLDEIEVRLSFRAGETTMDLATLRALAPGAIVETAEDADAVVDILANGRRIGTGELIDVAGRRAIQIRTLFAGA